MKRFSCVSCERFIRDIELKYSGILKAYDIDEDLSDYMKTVRLASKFGIGTMVDSEPQIYSMAFSNLYYELIERELIISWKLL